MQRNRRLNSTGISLQFIKTETMHDASQVSKCPTPQAPFTDANGDYFCQVDGSSAHDWKGAIGFINYNYAWIRLVAYHSAESKACCLFQAEASTILEAIKFVCGYIKWTINS